jgi:hypothetical protein
MRAQGFLSPPSCNCGPDLARLLRASTGMFDAQDTDAMHQHHHIRRKVVLIALQRGLHVVEPAAIRQLNLLCLSSTAGVK